MDTTQLDQLASDLVAADPAGAPAIADRLAEALAAVLDRPSTEDEAS